MISHLITYLQELLNLLPNMQKGEPTWAEMKQFGCGWWLKNVTLLRKCTEKVTHEYEIIRVV